MKSQAVDPALAARVPPGQILTAKWPVLTYGRTPRFDPARWTFRCYGLVEHATTWTWPEFQALPRVTITSDIHCVTRWSKLDNVWEGVPIREIIDRVKPLPEARFVMQHADPDYTTNTALGDLVQDDVILALKHGGRDLEPDHGGPLRLVLPEALLLEELEVAPRLRIPRRQPARLLGAERLPHARGSVDGGTVLRPGDSRHATDAC